MLLSGLPRRKNSHASASRQSRTADKDGLGNPWSNAHDYSFFASRGRWFFGFLLDALFALDGTRRALALSSPKVCEREDLPRARAPLPDADPGGILDPDQR